MSTDSTLRQRWFAWIYPHFDRAQAATTAAMRTELVGDLEGAVIEVGCGPGSNFQHYGAGARVLATDYNPRMVALARDVLQREPLPRATIEVRQADASALPIGDASFDAYVSTLVLCSVPDLDAALDEAWHVLRPGGEVRIFEHVRSSTAWKARVQSWLSPLWGYVADGCRLDRATDVAFRRRGFEVIEERRPPFPKPLPLVLLKARKPASPPETNGAREER